MLQALEDAYRKVQEVNDLQRQFLADVSHELRTPLTIMLSSLDLVSKVGATDRDIQARTLADMRVEVERSPRGSARSMIPWHPTRRASVSPWHRPTLRLTRAQ
jgi:two-component system, OmpR family, sensor kinase